MSKKDKEYSVKGTIPEKYVINPIGGKYDDQGYFVSRWAKNAKENEDFKSISELAKKSTGADVFVNMKSSKYIKKEAITVENKPMKIRLLTASNQSYKQNGTNYPVGALLPSGHVVPMSLDIMLEALTNSGMNKNGEFNDEFIMAGFGTRLQLIRVNSGLHNACLQHMEHLKIPKMKKLTFDIGSVYETATGKRGIFLGYVTTSIPSLVIDADAPPTNSRHIKHGKIHSIKFKNRNVKSATLWLPLYSYMDMNNIQQTFDNSYKYQTPQLVVGNSHNYIRKIEGKKAVTPSPKEMIYGAVKKGVEDLENQIKHWQQNVDYSKRNAAYSYGRNYALQLYSLRNGLSGAKLANVEIYGLKAKQSDILKRIEKDWFPQFIADHNASLGK